MAAAFSDPDAVIEQFLSGFLLDDYFGKLSNPTTHISKPPFYCLLPKDSTSDMMESLLATLAHVITRPIFSCKKLER